MATDENLQRQIDNILGNSKEKEVEVIVQMESQRDKNSRLAIAAGGALSHRPQALSPRELLPERYNKRVAPKTIQQTSSVRTRLGQSKAQAIALEKTQQDAMAPLAPLIENRSVGRALSRMSKPKKKSTRVKKRNNRFWTSRSMPLRLTRDELSRLHKEVDNIRSICMNRSLRVPSLVETTSTPKGAEEITVSSWGLEKINALSVWGAYGARGSGVTIGLLDTGVNAAHPDLEGKVEHWAEFDSMGQNLESDPYDSDEHGTHCAGTLVGSNKSGRFIGVAPEAKLAAALVLNGQNGGTDAQVLAGIDWAVEMGVDVISLSLGGLVMDYETPPTYTEAILSCIEAGIPVIAAIGNEGEQTTGSPGNDVFALSVGATDAIDRAAGFSGGRTQVISQSDYIADEFLPLAYLKPDLSAPGVAVFSSAPNGEYKSFSGTSMATPHVAGAIALLLSATNIKAKEVGARRAFTIQDLICGSVKDLGEAGQDQRYGFGRLDVLRAVDFARDLGY